MQASIATHLVDRFIWVWPHWTAKDNYEMYGNHTTGLANVGTFKYKTADGANQMGMCVCIKKVLWVMRVRNLK